MSIPQSGGGPIESYDQLAGYLADGCKPKDQWRIGTEHEKFGFTWNDLKPLPYDGEASIKAMLEGLRDKFGWSPIEENGYLIGLKKDGASVSLEPGGQFELSGAPLEHIHETCNEVGQHLKEVREIAEPLGADFHIGFGPEHDDRCGELIPPGGNALDNPDLDLESIAARTGNSCRLDAT